MSESVFVTTSDQPMVRGASILQVPRTFALLRVVEASCSEMRMSGENISMLPPAPQRQWTVITRLNGFIHGVILTRISTWYCKWTGLPPQSSCIYYLPFNLVLKYSHAVREDEAVAQSFAHSIGLPAPRVLSYGEREVWDHSIKRNFSYGSILMTRVSGQVLDDCHESLEPSQLASIMSDIDSCLAAMRRYSSPWGSQICSVLGGRVHGARIVGGRNGPYPDSLAFNHDYIQYKQTERWEREPVEEVLGNAEMMNTLSANHRIVFTHGDLLPHNILVRDGRLTAILDWEFSGWFPEYWEYTEMQRFSPRYFWSQQVVALPSYKYAAELKASRAMWTLASESFNWW